MLAVVSPAKNLDFSPTDFKDHSSARLLADTEELHKTTIKLTRADLRQLMKISEKLADLNYQRFQEFMPLFDIENAKQAVLAFNGDTYVGLDAGSLTRTDLKFAQKQLRIISGFYGLLRPLDLIQPYRLEMGTRLANTRGNNLYEFWGEGLADALNQDMPTKKNAAVINLASNEYFKAIDLKKLDAPVITPIFKEVKNGQSKTLGMFAKRARGMMARYMVVNKITDPHDLKDFNFGDYQYQPKLSTDTDWIFTRHQPDPVGKPAAKSKAK
jgi:cytoplasmic iron level regulating protein YaaA (DUF328/UPF0246 family)